MSSMPIFQSTCKQLLLEFVETLTHALAAKSVFKPFSAVHGRLKEGYLEMLQLSAICTINKNILRTFA